MKSKIIFILAFLFSISVQSQLSAVDYKSKDYNQFKASKTYVVLTGNSKYDTDVKAAITEFWTITPFAFISNKEFEKQITDKAASFLKLVIVNGSKNDYHYLALLNGGKKKISNYKYDDMLAYCPINFYKDESNLINCNYRIRNMVESMILSMDIVQKNDYHGSSLRIVNLLQKAYNEKASKIKERTLLFSSESIGDNLSKSDISGVYPYKFEVCSRKKIEEVIANKSKEYYYFQPGITLNKSMFVFDPSNGEVVYFEYAMMGLNINKGDIKDLVKTIDEKK